MKSVSFLVYMRKSDMVEQHTDAELEELGHSLGVKLQLTDREKRAW